MNPTPPSKGNVAWQTVAIITELAVHLLLVTEKVADIPAPRVPNIVILPDALLQTTVVDTDVS